MPKSLVRKSNIRMPVSGLYQPRSLVHHHLLLRSLSTAVAIQAPLARSTRRPSISQAHHPQMHGTGVRFALASSQSNIFSSMIFRSSHLAAAADRRCSRHNTAIHNKRFGCNVPGCAHQEPFGLRKDLDRHRTSCHPLLYPPVVYSCTISGCPYGPGGSRAFPRKDNRDRHVREHG